eukprot:jgi/Astpho2/3247/e_gw1.00052.22.1_t
MPITQSPDVVLQAFDQLPKDSSTGLPSNATMQQFMATYFSSAGSDFNQISPSDFSSEPKGFLPNVTDPGVRSWALAVNKLWQDLVREVNETVEAQPDQHSLLYLPYPTGVPGDRFRQLYYWDSYWVLQGLLVCGMTETATSQVRDLMTLLQDYGHVPNGARRYYLNRSQPPLLSQMVSLVYNANPDISLLQDALPLLQDEHDYWTSAPKGLQVAGPDGEVYSLSRYYANWTLPRPESYTEDVQSAAGMSPDAQARLWRDLASGAESGQDFSSRWFTDPTNISTIRTTQIIPAELNAYLFQMENNIARFAEILGENETAAAFTDAAHQRQEAVNTLMYDEASGHWRDLIIEDDSASPVQVSQRDTGIEYISDYIPLWVGMAGPGSEQAANVTQAFFESGLINVAGCTISTFNSSQQWDFPSSWPPTEWMMITALQNYGGDPGQVQARNMAQVYLDSMYQGFQTSGHMIEKYNALAPGLAGYGGEYTTQTGFGWSNGVALELLQTYGWQPENANISEPTTATTAEEANVLPGTASS